MNLQLAQTRLVMLDVETTGLSPSQGDRIVEIGLVEFIDRRPTGRQFHAYIDPERLVPDEVVTVHGLDNAFLSGKPKFADVVDEFIGFICGSELVIHNAPFDMAFLNMELARAGRPSLDHGAIGVIDTLVMSKLDGQAKRHSLDALCLRYGVNNKQRMLHGALLDAQLLGEVYVCMTRGQGSFLDESLGVHTLELGTPAAGSNRAIIAVLVSEEEADLHNAYLVGMLKDAGGKPALWLA